MPKKTTSLASQDYLILFDGVCNLCNGFVQFVIKNDANNRFKFAPLQSPTGLQFLEDFDIDPLKTDSIVLIHKNKAWVKSSAALNILKRLKGLYPLLYAGIVLPTRLRDSLYDWVAAHRYKWFGKKSACMIPTAEMRAKFL